MNLTPTDFLYGAILSNLINNDVKIALLESEDNGRRKYRVTTDTRDFILFAKYSKKPRKGDDYVSWQFQISKDTNELKMLLDSEQDFSLGLVCYYPSAEPKKSQSRVEKSHVVYLWPNDVKELLTAEKDTLTVRYDRNKQKYTIPMRGREALQIETTRPY